MKVAEHGTNGPALEIWAIDRLKPYDANPRTIPGKAITKVAGSLREFGFQKPIVVDEHGVIIAGHVLWKAAQSAGITRVPVAISRLTPAQAKAYRLADNRTASETDWIDDLLRNEMTELKALDFDLSLTGFDDRELQKLLSDDADMERAEDTPDVPVNPVTVLGDVWLLGAHRIVCGDSTKAGDVAKALNGVTPHLMVTDPPYGVNYDPNWRNEADRASGKAYGATAVGVVLNDDRADWTEAYVLFPGEVTYVWHPPGAMQVMFHNSLVAAGFEIRMQIVWAKSHAPIGRGHYHVSHEPCWYAVRKKAGATGHWQGDRTQTTIWKIDKPRKSETGHSTQKPIECMRRPMINNSSPGQAVYDPFSGSGTSIIAGEMTGRHVHAIELNPAYVDVAVERWQTFTGQTAIHEATGKTFAALNDERYSSADDAQKSYTAGIDAMREKITAGGRT